MAKKKDVSTIVDNLIQVTEANRKFCIKLGRKVHRYKKTTKGYEYHHWFDIRPRLQMGWLTITGGEIPVWKVFISKDEDREDYIDGFDSIIKLGIKEGILYINPEEPLIKYDCSWDKKK